MKDFLAKAKLSPLHTHTNYSILDGASSLDEYIEFCKKNELPGLGVTDHGWAIGGLELYKKCKKAGITPLPGVEFYVAPDKDYQFSKKPYDYYHVTAWAVSEVGYRNLMKLASMSWNQDKLKGGKIKKGETEADRVVSMWGGKQLKPRITFDELLGPCNEGLVLGTGCLIGALNKAFMNGEFKGAERNLLRLLEVYKGRIFAEIMPHACSHNYSREEKRFIKNQPLVFDECKDFDLSGSLQVACNNQIIKLARKYDLPLLMTIDSHFVKPEQKRLQDVLLSSSDSGWTFYESYHMYDVKTAAEAWANLHGWDIEQQKIFQESVENNDVLVNCAKGLEIKDPFRQPKPEFPVELKSMDPKEARKQMLISAVVNHGRMKWDNPEWAARLQKEIDVICDNGIVDFSDYFIFLEYVYRWAAEHSLFAGAGRGSAAGSLLAYCLKITHLDPMAWNLPFERFLSNARLKRLKFPDIDCDFGNRDLLIDHLREKYGDKFAQASTLGTIKLKTAVRDAVRAILGSEALELADVVCKTIPTEPQGVGSKDFLVGYKDQDGVFHDGHIHENPVLEEFFDKYPNVKDAVLQLLGIPRSIGRHASAFLVSDAPISDTVPTCYISGVLCTQYQATASNNMLEAAGLIKFDFLRVNTLSDISNCIRMVQKKYGHKVWEEEVVLDGVTHKIMRGDLPIDTLPTADGSLLNIYDLPEDPGVFASLTAGNTETVFQMNSSLMTGFTKRIRPTTLRHISDICALVRPGPLLAQTGIKDSQGKPLTMTEGYIAAKNGLIEPSYAHEGMRSILEETYGCAAYQEQLQQMFVDLAGYSLEEADYLRETLAKKKRQDMEKAIPELRKRLKERGWSDKQQDVFVSLCISSSAYSFNRAHSAAYATAAYQCAYLKFHHPIEWWTSVLQNAKVEDIREKGYAHTLQQAGILELPSINGPTDTFRPENNKVLSPLYLIDRIGGVGCLEIENQRRKDGPFLSLQDFFERVDGRKVNQAVFENLIICDAFRDIEKGKDSIELLMEYHYLKKVSSLAIGQELDPNVPAKVIVDEDGISANIVKKRMKVGQALRDAVQRYKQKEIQTGKCLQIPITELNGFDLEIARATALPIYSLNIHSNFKQALETGAEVLYGADEATIRRGRESIRVYRTLDELKQNVGSSVRGCWAGIVQSHKTFQYTDKRSKEKVTALKMQIYNDGESIEAVVWPDLFKVVGEPKTKKIAFVLGQLKESLEPGKWEMSVSEVKFI